MAVNQSDPKVQLQVGADTREAVSKFDALFARIADGMKLGLGLDVGQRITQAIAEIPQRLKGWMDTGIAFNSQLESANISIAAMLHQFDKSKWGSMEAGLKTSAELIKAMRHEAETTVATFEDLLGASQVFMGPALSAGLRAEQVPALASMLSRAVSTLLGPQFANPMQLAQEGRALLTGDIGPDATVARQLGITRQDILQARQSGRLLEFLTGKLGAFNEAAELSAQSLSGLKSNLQDAWNGISAEATKPVFERLKKITSDVIRYVGSPEFERGAIALGQAADKTLQLGAWGAGNWKSIALLGGLFIGPKALPWALGRMASSVKSLIYLPETIANVVARLSNFTTLMSTLGPATATAAGALASMTAALGGYSIGRAVGAAFPEEMDWWAAWIQWGFARMSPAERDALINAPDVGTRINAEGNYGFSPSLFKLRQQPAKTPSLTNLDMQAMGLNLAMRMAGTPVGFDGAMIEKAMEARLTSESNILQKVLQNLKPRTFGSGGYFFSEGGAAAQREQSKRGEKALAMLQEIMETLRRPLKVELNDLPV